MNIGRNIVTAILMTIATTVLLGIVYPLVVTGVAQVVFPAQANGQLIERSGKVIGSRVIGQSFSSPGYFRPRPSAAGAGYDAANSAGTQLGPTNKKLVDTVKANVEAAYPELDILPPDEEEAQAQVQPVHRGSRRGRQIARHDHG